MPVGARATLYGTTAGSSAGTGQTATEVTSLISANAGNIQITAGQDAAVAGPGQGNVLARGADLIAGEKIAVTGAAIDLQAASDRSESAFQSQSKSVTIGGRHRDQRRRRCHPDRPAHRQRPPGGRQYGPGCRASDRPRSCAIKCTPGKWDPPAPAQELSQAA